MKLKELLDKCNENLFIKTYFTAFNVRCEVCKSVSYWLDSKSALLQEEVAAIWLEDQYLCIRFKED